MSTPETFSARAKRRREEGTHATGLVDRPQKRRSDGTHEPNIAARSRKRREDGTHELNIASRSQKRRDEGNNDPNIAARPLESREGGTREPNVAARSQKRREDGTHEPDVAARSQQRREDGTREPDAAERAQKRRDRGTHGGNPSARLGEKRRGLAEDACPRDPPDSEHSLHALCRGTGVAYIEPQIAESNSARERRHGRMRLRSLRTGRPAGWRDTCLLEERASAVGVSFKTPGPGKEAATRRANIRAVWDREEAYLGTIPALPPLPVAPPPDTPL